MGRCGEGNGSQVANVRALGLALVTLRAQLRSVPRPISEPITRVAFGKAVPAPRSSGRRASTIAAVGGAPSGRRCLPRSRRYGPPQPAVMVSAPHLCYQELTVFFNQTRHFCVGLMVLIPDAYAARPVAKESVRVICEEHPSCKRKNG